MAKITYPTFLDVPQSIMVCVYSVWSFVSDMVEKWVYTYKGCSNC